MVVPISIVNAFTHEGKGGNGAGVVLEAPTLTREQKMRIAAQVGLSETVFVSSSSCADYRLEYFTPTDEVELCGHATIATFALLHQRGLSAGIYSIETLSGILSVEVEASGRIWMQQCLPVFSECYESSEFAGCIPDAYRNLELPIQAVSTGLKDILYPVKDRTVLSDMVPNFTVMADINRLQGVVGVHAFALLDDGQAIAECRNFAPLYGIDEESATGTSNCALACYLFRYYRKQPLYRFVQGVSMGCPSVVEVRIQASDSEITSVYVGGMGQETRQLHVVV